MEAEKMERGSLRPPLIFPVGIAAGAKL